MITRKRIENSLEKRIFTAMIFSDEFLSKTFEFVNPNYFTDELLKKLSKWCLEYYDRYEKAPGKHINDLLDSTVIVSQDEWELYKKLVEDVISQEVYANNMNIPYLLDETVNYFKSRELSIISSNISVLLDKGKLQDAEDQLLSYNKIAVKTSKWFSPFDLEKIDALFRQQEDGILEFPGDLGKYIGPIRRGWFIGVEGGFKRGKTFFLFEFASQAILSRLRTVIFSLEMSEEDCTERIIKRLTGCTSTGFIKYPVFDCYSNQSGACQKAERVNKITLLDASGRKPMLDKKGYKVCDVCRGTSNYKFETWFESKITPIFDHQEMIEQAEKLKLHYDQYLRMRSFPRFSATMDDIKRELDSLEKFENFIPDVVVIDYADIVRDDKRLGVEKEDYIWMRMGQLATERSCIVVTGSQIGREGLEANSITEKHTSKWIGKLGHINVMLTVNQTETEKDEGVVRIGCLEHRHKKHSKQGDCIVLQNLDSGQFYLDSLIL